MIIFLFINLKLILNEHCPNNIILKNNLKCLTTNHLVSKAFKLTI